MSSSSNSNLLMDLIRSSQNSKYEPISKVILLDGGTGEELFRQGVPDDRKIWSATAIVHEKYHETLKQVHRSFIQAGAQMITTNSYGITPGVGFSIDDIHRFCNVAGRLARETADEVPGTLVLGSLGPLVESYRPDRIMEHSKGVEVYKNVVQALFPHVDAYLAETMSSVEESMQAVEALSKLDRPLQCLVSYTLDYTGKLRSGEDVVIAISRLLDFSESYQVKVISILFNCAEPEAITQALQRIHEDSVLQERIKKSGILLGAYANRLTPVAKDWSLAESSGPQEMRNDLDPQQYFHQFVSHWTTDLNAQIVGGCCGITPEHIAYIKKQLQQQKSSQTTEL